MTDKLIVEREIALSVVSTLERKRGYYGDSWKRRGGVGAFMMLARKWDRIENTVQRENWDVFECLRKDTKNGVDLRDDLEDLVGYLLLVLAETADPHCPGPTLADDDGTAGPTRSYVDQDGNPLQMRLPLRGR